MAEAHALALGLFPILAVLVLLWMGVPPVYSSLAGLAAGLASSLAYGAPVSLITDGLAWGASTALEVMAVTLAGVFLFEVANAAGSHREVGGLIKGLGLDEGWLVLLVVMGVLPLIDSLTGLGIGVVFNIPILLWLGYDARRATILGLLGFVAAAWGAFGMGMLVASRFTGVDFDELGFLSGIASLPGFIGVSAAALIVQGGYRYAIYRIHRALYASIALWLGITASNYILGTYLAGILGSLASSLAIYWAAAPPGTKLGVRTENPRSLLPYMIPMATVSIALYAVKVSGIPESLGYPGRALSSPPLWLLAATLLSGYLAGVGLASMGGLFIRALKRWLPAGIAILAFLELGGLLTASGLYGEIARALTSLGGLYIAFSPWIGGLGGLLTGSSTASNSLLAYVQYEAAVNLGLDAKWIVTIQNVSAAVMTMASGVRIQLAMSVLEPEQRDPTVFRPLFALDSLILTVYSLIFSVGIALREAP